MVHYSHCSDVDFSTLEKINIYPTQSDENEFKLFLFKSFDSNVSIG